jgi:hypothetical protein
MDNKELIRRLALLKANPKLAETIPQGEVLKMLSDVVASFNVLKAAIEAGKIKGEKGDSFKLTPDVDYPSLTRYDAKIEREIALVQSNYQNVIKTLEKRVSALKNGADGKDAEITDAIKQEIAELTLSLIELPDFDAIVTSEITKNGEAIRNALELLSGDDRYKVEIADVEGLTEALKQLAQIRGDGRGGIGKSQVYNFIRQAVEDGTIPAGGAGGGHTIEDEGTPLIQRNTLNFTGDGVTVTDAGGKTVVNIPAGGGGGVTVTDPTGAIDGSNVTFTSAIVAKWIDTDTGHYYEGFGYARSGSTYTMDLAPNFYIKLIS